MKSIRIVIGTLLVLILVGAGAAGLYIQSGAFDVSATAEHHPVTDRLFRAVRRNSVARGEREVESRLPERLTESELHVAAIGYEDMCAACHVPPGRTQTALARGLNPEPPDLVRAAGRYTPEKLFWVTKHGIRMTGMPAWGITHTDDELWQLVAFIRMFPGMTGTEYEQLVAAARAAGVEHVHDHDHEQDHEHDHDHRHDLGG